MLSLILVRVDTTLLELHVQRVRSDTVLYLITLSPLDVLPRVLLEKRRVLSRRMVKARLLLVGEFNFVPCFSLNESSINLSLSFDFIVSPTSI